MKINLGEGICISIVVVVLSIMVYCCHQSSQRAKRIRQHTLEMVERFDQIEKEQQRREAEYEAEEKEYVTVKDLDNIEVVAKVELPSKEIIEFRMSPKVCNYDLVTQQIILSKVQVYYLLLDREKIFKNSTVVSLCIEKCK